MDQPELQFRPPHVLEDPSSKAVARVYALAYLDAALQAGVHDPLEEFTSFNDDVLNSNPQLLRLLTTQMIGRDDKLGLIERVVAPQASEFFTNFLRVLARHERLEILQLVLSEAWLEQERRAGQKRVQVISAVPLSEEQLGRITDRLKETLSIDPIVLSEVDPDLLGGLVVRVGDTVFDGSLRTKLRTLRESLRERYLNEIQSGRNRFSHSERD